MDGWMLKNLGMGRRFEGGGGKRFPGGFSLFSFELQRRADGVLGCRGGHAAHAERLRSLIHQLH